jgi:hypothetical protein
VCSNAHPYRDKVEKSGAELISYYRQKSRKACMPSGMTIRVLAGIVGLIGLISFHLQRAAA